MTQDATKGRPLLDWQTQVIRCTTFFQAQPEAAPVAALRSLWEEIANGKPDKVVEKPKEAIVVIYGRFADGRLTLTGRPDGFDLRLHLPPEESTDVKTVPSLGGFEQLCTEFYPLACKLLGAGVPSGVSRIAFGALVHLQVANRLEAYRQLEPYLDGVVANPENLYDLLYRCNRRRDSSVLGKGVYINRLNTWTVATLQEILGTFSERGMSQRVVRSTLVVQLELDINTPGDHDDPLPPGKLVNVFEELTDVGREIARAGDIP